MSSSSTDGRHEGSIELVIGPMFSEKTTTLLSRIRRATYAGCTAVIVKHESDSRYAAGAEIATHSDLRQSTDAAAGIQVVVAAKLHDIAGEVDRLNPAIVGVDEGQFYDDLVHMCETWANEGRRVIVAALDGDSTRAPFGAVCALVPLCESVLKLSGVCMRCRHRESAFTRRTAAATTQILVGAQESYQGVCRRCYFERAPTYASPTEVGPLK